MTALRHLLRSRPGLAALILAAALLLRVLVPAGFMPSADGKTLTLCSGMARASAMAMPGMTHHDGDDAAAQTPCAYADLALPALGGVDLVLLAAVLVFARPAAPTRRISAPPRIPVRLRPPLRAPPFPG